MRIALTALASVALASCTPSRSAAAAGEEGIRVPGVGTVFLALPDGWSPKVRRAEKGLPPTIEVAREGRDRFVLLLSTFVASPAKRKEFSSKGGLRPFVEGMAREIASSAVEKRLELVPIGGGKDGFYYGATDRAPAPGDFRYLLQGAVPLGEGIYGTFTLMTDGAGAPPIAQAIELLRTARAVPTPGPSIARRQGAYVIALPEGLGTVSFPARDLEVEQADDARPYYLLVDRKAGLNVSFNFEPARECTTSRACRDRFAAKLKRLYPKRQGWREDQVGEVFLSENTDPGVEGVPIAQHHANAHLVVNGVWVDVHLSKVRYADPDRPLFLDFVRSLRTESAR